jgi:hypothetical protein
MRSYTDTIRSKSELDDQSAETAKLPVAALERISSNRWSVLLTSKTGCFRVGSRLRTGHRHNPCLGIHRIHDTLFNFSTRILNDTE